MPLLTWKIFFSALAFRNVVNSYSACSPPLFSKTLSPSRMSLLLHASRSLMSMSVEVALRKRGFQYIIGCDEVGRGCIAGPVVTASCCILTSDFSTYEPFLTLNDSKALSEVERNGIYNHIMSNPKTYAWCICERSNMEIDSSNILKATMECFRESILRLVQTENLPLDSTYAIVDGNKSPKLSKFEHAVACRPWVKGDANVYSVALASVIAKVTRDRMMKTDVHQLYPQYGFDSHKGYPTRRHIEAIHMHGPCPHHRMSFKTLKGRG